MTRTIDPPAPAALLAVALDAATTAGRHALRHHARRREVLSRAHHDVKLALDVECQAKAEGIVRRAFPDHAILGEESAASRGPRRGPVTWIIDPIDGTVNFHHDIPCWCCSVAARVGRTVQAGVVFAPAMQECYCGSLHGPSMRNGKPIQVSDESRVDAAIVMTGLDKHIDPRLPPFEVFRTLSVHVQKARVMGAAALDICRVAAGQAEGYFESGIYLWDVAAASCIVRGAGGRTEVLQRFPEPHRMSFLASNGRLHRPLKALIRQATAV